MAVENDSKAVQDVNILEIDADEYFATYSKCAVYMVAEEMIDRLPASKRQREILHFIRKRTIRFGKLVERITLDQIRNGVYKKGTDELVTLGIGCKRIDAVEDLRLLEGSGYIQRQAPNSRTVFYGLSAKLLSKDGCLQVPTPSEDRCLQVPTGGQSWVPVGTSKIEIRDKKEKEGIKPPGVTAGVVETLTPAQGEVVVNLQERIDQAKNRNRAKRAHKAQSLAINFTISNLNALWADLMLQHFPDSRFPGRFTVDMFHRLKAGLKAQGLLDNSDDAIELIRYSVENWTYLYTFCNWDRIGLFSAQPTPMAIASGIKILVEGRNRNEASARYHSADTAQTRIAAQDRKFKERQQYVAAKKQYEAPDPMGDDEDDDGFFAKRFNRELDNLWAAR